MKTLLLAAAGLAVSTPVLAQVEPGTATPTEQKTMPAAPPAPVASTPPVVDAGAAVTTSTGQAAPTDPKALIASEFPTYDKDGNGQLSKVEFGAWMDALQAKTGKPPLTGAKHSAYIAGAFGTADRDKSNGVSLAELQTYLTTGA